MTVTELMRFLEKMPRGAVVVLSRDSEGNGFSPAETVEGSRYIADRGELSTTEGVPCVVLWPTH